ncbi:MAG: TIGR00730 family Rossman fold protein [Phycisphaerales bacterium]|nr:TIGR00730 family Rossman fold protein [Phycisphaerales bacterium]
MSTTISRLCVFCGSASGARPAYREAARGLGRAMAERKISLVYGGGSRGLMGDVADGVLEAGGEVVGVITRQLVDKEVAHGHIKDLRVVETMHERKKMMADMADGFVALPGGYGTLDEFFEMMAWAQLGLHTSPVGMLNTEGFYDRLVGFLEHARGEGFLRLDFRTGLRIAEEPRRLLDAMMGIAESR